MLLDGLDLASCGAPAGLQSCAGGLQEKRKKLGLCAAASYRLICNPS